MTKVIAPPRKPARAAARSRAPKYAVIRDWLAKRIAAGDFSAGQQLPSEHEIMQRFTVSRVTARQALDTLKKCGQIESRHGKGYFVRRPQAVARLERLQSFGEMMAPLAISTRSNVIELMEVPATREVAEALRLEARTPVTRIVRQRIAGEATLSLDISFFPVDVGRKLVQLDLQKEDVFILLERKLGFELGYADLTIDVVEVDPRHARFVGAAPGESVLRIQRLTIDNNGRPIDYERLYARFDAMKFKVRVPRG
jgi:GntR family transcriptional regulator